jgi:hypothetical protein
MVELSSCVGSAIEVGKEKEEKKLECPKAFFLFIQLIIGRIACFKLISYYAESLIYSIQKTTNKSNFQIKHGLHRGIPPLNLPLDLNLEQFVLVLTFSINVPKIKKKRDYYNSHFVIPGTRANEIPQSESYQFDMI